MSKHRFAVLLLPLLLSLPAHATDPATKPAAKQAARPASAAPSSLRWNLDAHDISTLNSQELAKKADVAGRIDEIGKAARGGDATAQMLAAQAYFNGSGVAKDLGEAAYWADRAVKGGNARAMLVQAALASERGDHGGAMDLRRRAADAGIALAMFNIASVYLDGNAAFPANSDQGFAWLRRAADGGVVYAMGYLGAAYMNGSGIPQDEVTGVSWIRKAAELGDLQAIHMMGQVYLTGRGVPHEDLEVARAWLRRGIARGDAQCLKLYNEINQALAMDMAAAQQRARASQDSDDELLRRR